MQKATKQTGMLLLAACTFSGGCAEWRGKVPSSGCQTPAAPVFKMFPPPVDLVAPQEWDNLARTHGADAEPALPHGAEIQGCWASSDGKMRATLAVFDAQGSSAADYAAGLLMERELRYDYDRVGLVKRELWDGTAAYRLSGEHRAGGQSRWECAFYLSCGDKLAVLAIEAALPEGRERYYLNSADQLALGLRIPQAPGHIR